MRVPALRVLVRRMVGTGAGNANAIPAPAPLVGPRVRLAVYALAVVAWGGWATFTRLGEGMVVHDEAAFAYTTDHMLASGDWVVPRISEHGPHLNATPLYNWLSALTAEWAGTRYLRYRLWAAVFAVACGLATLALGTLLFSAEVGFLAGLVLLSNRYFLFAHAARAGMMETGLAFFVTCLVACYVKAAHSETRPRLWWALAGLSLAGAVLTKPPVMGGFFFGVICLHHLAVRRDLPWKSRLVGPFVALAVCVAVAGAWFAVMYSRVGWVSLESLFLFNSVGRAAEAGGYTVPQPPWFYVDHVPKSSRAFGLALPAVVVAGLLALRGRAGFAWGLPALLATAFVAALSCAATKHTHYFYATLPLLSVLTAALFLVGFGPPPASGPRARVAWRLVGIVGAVAAGILVWKDCRTAAKDIQKPRWDYPPALVHDAIRGEIEAGRARLVLFAFPDGTEYPDRTLGFTPADPYYGQFRLPLAVRVRTARELNALLADGTPSVLFLPPFLRFEQLVREGVTAGPDRELFTRSEDHPYPVLLFRGADRVCHLRELLEAIRTESDGIH
jgi:4-amino-4-deoxy-L-arabinose transferase-like glycosyltransferase